VLEFAAPRAFFLNTSATVFADLDERQHPDAGDLLVSRYLAGHPLDAAGAVSLALSLGPEGPLSEALLGAARRLDPRELEPVRRLTNLLARTGRRSEAKVVLDSAEPKRTGWGPRPLRLQFEVALETCRASRTAFTPGGDCAEAIRLGERLVELPDVPAADHRGDVGDLAKALLSAGRFEAAAALYRKVLADRDGAADPPARRAAWLSGAAAASLRTGDRRQAGELARQALALEPRQPAALLVLAASAAGAGLGTAGAP
jgi:tetratricopeptide (TPR) repeat protein